MSESDASRPHLKAYGQKRNTWICLMTYLDQQDVEPPCEEREKCGKESQVFGICSSFLVFFYSYKATVFLLNWDFTTIKTGKTQKACDQA